MPPEPTGGPPGLSASSPDHSPKRPQRRHPGPGPQPRGRRPVNRRTPRASSPADRPPPPSPPAATASTGIGQSRLARGLAPAGSGARRAAAGRESGARSVPKRPVRAPTAAPERLESVAAASGAGPVPRGQRRRLVEGRRSSVQVPGLNRHPAARPGKIQGAGRIHAVVVQRRGRAVGPSASTTLEDAAIAGQRAARLVSATISPNWRDPVLQGAWKREFPASGSASGAGLGGLLQPLGQDPHDLHRHLREFRHQAEEQVLPRCTAWSGRSSRSPWRCAARRTGSRSRRRSRSWPPVATVFGPEACRPPRRPNPSTMM